LAFYLLTSINERLDVISKYYRGQILNLVLSTTFVMEVYSEDRPWGKFEKFHENKPCTVKLIYVNPNSRLSLQYHNKRSEFWKVVFGTAYLQLDDSSLVLKEGQTIEIPNKARHRVEAKETKCVILEISYGIFDENDIVRLDDDYQRESPTSTH
jgi:mannose-6-phosphate isomerase